MTKTTIALVAALIAGTASVASAQEFDPNLGNRYPSYNGPVAAAPGLQSSPVRLQHKQQVLQSAPVRLQNNTGGYTGQGYVGQGYVGQGYADQGVTPSEGRPQVHTFRYDSAPVISTF